MVLDREKAFLLEVSMGEVEEQSSLQDQVPPRTRATDWGGYRERRIERHVDQEVERHYERVAEALFLLFQR